MRSRPPEDSRPRLSRRLSTWRLQWPTGNRWWSGGAGSSDVPSGKVSLNRASAAELEVLNGVGPVLASRIVAYREANGLFTAVEDLLDVSGIGEAKLATIRETVVVP